MMQTISLQSAPEIKRLINQAFPYKKHNAFLSPFPEHGVGINSYWDGGSRDTYVVVDLANGTRKTLPTSTHPYFDITRAGLNDLPNPDVEVDRVGNVILKHLPEGFALVQGGTFCGKQATAHVYLNPANLAKLLEAPSRS